MVLIAVLGTTTDLSELGLNDFLIGPACVSIHPAVPCFPSASCLGLLVAQPGLDPP